MNLKDYKEVLENLKNEGIKVDKLSIFNIRYSIIMYKKYGI